ncbi:lysozyme inhibitor LprI family protein [Mailhella sp.]
MTNSVRKICSGFVLALSLCFAAPALPALAEDAPSYAEQADRIYDECVKKTYGNSEKYLTPTELTEILDKYYKKLDKLLNETWKETRRFLKNADPALFEQLLADQRAWLKFADSFSTAVYTGFGSGGSMYRSMGMDAKMSLWAQRIKYLDTVLGYVSEVHGAPEK